METSNNYDFDDFDEFAELGDAEQNSNHEPVAPQPSKSKQTEGSAPKEPVRARKRVNVGKLFKWMLVFGFIGFGLFWVLNNKAQIFEFIATQTGSHEQGPTPEELLQIEMRKTQSELAEQQRSIRNASENLTVFSQNADQAIKSANELREIVINQGTELEQLRELNEQLLLRYDELATFVQQQGDTSPTQDLSEINRLVVRHEKNLGWVINRLDKAEAKIHIAAEKLGQYESKLEVLPSVHQVTKRVTTDSAQPWSVRGAGTNVAFLINTNTKQSLRVSIGVDVPSCGPVLSIQPAKRIVKTQSCTISGA